MRHPKEVAMDLMLASLYRLEYYQACDFCDAGESDECGGDKPHSDECPFYGYDQTSDMEALYAWAKGT